MDKNRSLTGAQMSKLLSQLNAYVKRSDTPAKVEDLHVRILENRVQTSFRLVPIGDMDAVKWNLLNENIEAMIQRILARTVTKE